jgi:hypothetical protein
VTAQPSETAAQRSSPRGRAAPNSRRAGRPATAQNPGVGPYRPRSRPDQPAVVGAPIGNASQSPNLDCDTSIDLGAATESASSDILTSGRRLYRATKAPLGVDSRPRQAAGGQQTSPSNARSRRACQRGIVRRTGPCTSWSVTEATSPRALTSTRPPTCATSGPSCDTNRGAAPSRNSHPRPSFEDRARTASCTRRGRALRADTPPTAHPHMTGPPYRPAPVRRLV